MGTESFTYLAEVRWCVKSVVSIYPFSLGSDGVYERASAAIALIYTETPAFGNDLVKNGVYTFIHITKTNK